MARKKERSPAFQVYPKDAMSDEIYQLMNNRQKGIYWDFLLRAWIEGSIPSDIQTLAMLAKEDERDFETLWPLISRKFKLKGKRYVNARLLKEEKKQKNYSKRMRENAHKLWRKKSQLVPDRERIETGKSGLPSKPSHSNGNALQFASSSLALAPSVGSQREPQNGAIAPSKTAEKKTDPKTGRAYATCHPLVFADPGDDGVPMCNSCMKIPTWYKPQ